MGDRRHAGLGENFRQRGAVVLVRMHAAGRDEADQMAGAAALFQSGDQAGQRRRLLDLAGGDGVADARQVLHHHAAGADVEMADLGVAHLPGRQSDLAAVGPQEGVGTAAPASPSRRGRPASPGGASASIHCSSPVR